MSKSNINLGCMFQYLNIEKVAQIVSSTTTSSFSSKSNVSNKSSNSFGRNSNPFKNNNTISSSGSRPPRVDSQPLHNIPESSDINMPKDMGTMSKFKNTQSALSHLKDNHLLSLPKTSLIR